MLDGSFGALHLRSINVAFSIRDAVEEHAIPNSVLEPIVPGAAGYWRAVGRLNNLAALMSAAAGKHLGATPAIAVLFIDSSLWSRVIAGSGARSRLNP